METVLKYLKPCTKTVIVGLIIKFIAAMVELFIPYILEAIIDDVIPTGSVKKVVFCGLLMIICALIAAFGNITANRLSAISAGTATKNMRHDLFDKITRLSSKKTDEFTEASLVSRLTSDTYNVNQFIARMQRLGIRAPILLIGGIILTSTLDLHLSLVLMLMLPAVGVVVYVVTKAGIPIYARVQSALDDMVRTVQENITGIRVIKALSKTDYERKRFSGVNEKLSANERRASDVMAASNPLTTLILNIGLVLVVVYGAYRINAGLSKPGTVIAFLSYFTIMLNAMLGVTKIFVLYTKGITSAKRVAEVLDSPDDMPVLPENTKSGDCHIEFENVSFSYNKIENNLSNLSFCLKKGQTLGIIGATGSGKTTIINLLMRFYDVDSGCIRINGKDVRTIPEEVLHTMFGVTFQNDFIIADTMKKNISFGRDISDEDIEKAAKCACVYEYVTNFPDGFSHMLTAKGTNISGGQKQRLLIARALAGNPEILILDDSSSALDYQTDAQFRKNLHEGYRDTTTVIIAQRISSIKHADLIIVLDDGNVIGMGTHDELMKNCRTYITIEENQMGGAR